MTDTVTPLHQLDQLDQPHHIPAEQAVLGACLQHPHLVDQPIEAGLHAEHLYHQAHRLVWYAIVTLHAAGGTINTHTVADEITRRGHTPNLSLLFDLADAGLSAVDTRYDTRLILDAHRRRTHMARGTRLVQQARNPETPLEVLDNIPAQWAAEDAQDAVTLPQQRTVDIDTFLATGEGDDDYDWVIPGLLERGDRLIITGPEGGGKSTLLRQIAIQAATGIHPFTGAHNPPARVLHLDLENSARQTRRKYRPLRHQAGPGLDPDNLHITTRLDGIDLTQPADTQWLHTLCEQARPDILITGPIYKMATGDPTEEKSAKPVAMALDRIRATIGCAIILEAHSPKALGGAKKRAHEPYGWSGWLRWPEFGLWLDEAGDLSHWRGMRDERDFPEMLVRGGTWPWSPATSPLETKWVRIRKCILDAGRKLSVREIEQGTGISRSEAQRVLSAYNLHHAALLAQLQLEEADDED